MKRSFSLALLCAFCITACNEVETSSSGSNAESVTANDAAKSSTENSVGASETVETTEITAIDADSDNDAAETMSSYAPSSFSQYVYVKSDTKVFLIDFNFFPEGTDFDSQNKTATLPCETAAPEGSGATVSMSAPEEGDGCEAVVVDLTSATFTFVGLEFAYEDSLDVFSEALEFKITPEGIADASDGEVIDLDFEDANLENAYNAVMDRRL